MRIAVSTSLLAAIVGLMPGCTKSSSSRPATLERAAKYYESQPRYLRPVPYTPVPKGLNDLSAATCGACHAAIYEEWRISTHARAWKDDAQFLAELAKSEKQGVGWLCMHCHTPLVNQLPRVVVGLTDGRLDRPQFEDNPAFDAKLQQDAITCATCHVKDGVVLGPYGDTAAPHPVKKSQALLTAEVCTQCHQAQARFDELKLICVFNTGEEFAASPYAKEGKVCQDCHMPVVERPLWTGGQKPRRTRRHWFGGSLIPKRPEFADEMAALRPHYPPGLAIRVTELPVRARPGETVEIELEIENAEAGHYLPTGDPERFLRIRVHARGPKGQTLADHIEKIGIEYQWYPEVVRLSDNRLAPKERRKLRFAFDAPASGPVKVEIEASRWRISEENLDYHDLQGRYVPGQTFFETTREVTVNGT